MPRGDRPFQLHKRINNNAYNIDLPLDYQVHNTFNVCDLSLINTLEGDESPNLRSNYSQDGEDGMIQKTPKPFVRRQDICKFFKSYL